MTTQNSNSNNYLVTIIGLGLSISEQPEAVGTYEAALEIAENFKNNLEVGTSVKIEITNNNKVVYFKNWMMDSKGLDFVNLQD